MEDSNKNIWNDPWRDHKVKVITMISIMVIAASLVLIGIKSSKPKNTMMEISYDGAVNNNWMWTH